MNKEDIIIKTPTPRDIEYFFTINKSVNFRYYDKRDFDVINNHIYTSLYYYKDKVIGYGHIDNDGERKWLGIFISSDYRNKGVGNIIMDDLLENGLNEIYLTVDVDNINAIKLYKKKGFKILNNINNYYLMLYKK